MLRILTAQELRAKRALDRLAILSQTRALVVRSGSAIDIAASGVVLADIFVLAAGDQVLVDALGFRSAPSPSTRMTVVVYSFLAFLLSVRAPHSVLALLPYSAVQCAVTAVVFLTPWTVHQLDAPSEAAQAPISSEDLDQQMRDMVEQPSSLETPAR